MVADFWESINNSVGIQGFTYQILNISLFIWFIQASSFSFSSPCTFAECVLQLSVYSNCNGSFILLLYRCWLKSIVTINTYQLFYIQRVLSVCLCYPFTMCMNGMCTWACRYMHIFMHINRSLVFAEQELLPIEISSQYLWYMFYYVQVNSLIIVW